jgi:hypothetical protein
VQIDIVIRGICTLRPGVPRLSETVRVVSIVGRLLEHSRIYRFANAGAPAYFIGSSDLRPRNLRPRNLRRRVELLAPVPEAAHRARLDDILARSRRQHGVGAAGRWVVSASRWKSAGCPAAICRTPGPARLNSASVGSFNFRRLKQRVSHRPG